MEMSYVTDTLEPKGTPRMISDRYQAPDEDDIRKAMRFYQAVNAFRTIDPKIPSSYVAAFMAVAMKPGQGPTEYAKMLGTIQPIASRVLLEIGIKAREREKALGLVDRVADPNNLRQQMYYLTPKGKALFRQVMDILEA